MSLTLALTVSLAYAMEGEKDKDSQTEIAHIVMESAQNFVCPMRKIRIVGLKNPQIQQREDQIFERVCSDMGTLANLYNMSLLNHAMAAEACDTEPSKDLETVLENEIKDLESVTACRNNLIKFMKKSLNEFAIDQQGISDLTLLTQSSSRQIEELQKSNRDLMVARIALMLEINARLEEQKFNEGQKKL